MAETGGSEDVTFVVPGAARRSAGATRGDDAPEAARSSVLGTHGRVVQSVGVSAQRDGGESVRMTARPGRDAVVLHIADGPSLMLHPETARDLMMAQSGVARGRTRSSGTPANEVPVAAQLSWEGLEAGGAARGASRSGIGKVLLSAIDIVTDLVLGSAAESAAKLLGRHVDDQVDPGVYLLRAGSLAPLKNGGDKLQRIESPTGGGPVLVFLHGTFSDTHGTFGKLWTRHPQRARALVDHYGGRAYALDHPTLTASPIENALHLAEALPDGARVHLVTHSRGGLVGEVLARVCAQQELDARSLQPFEAPGHERQLEALRRLSANLKGRGIQVERFVRVACPARGTLLASKRLDAYVSVLKWTLELAGIPVAPALVEFLGEVATKRTDTDLLPGLEAMVPDSPLVKWLHAAREPLPGQLRVVAGDIQGDSVASWVKTLLSDAFYWTDNDFVVQTRSMYGGTPRAPVGAEVGATFLLDRGGNVSHFGYFANERTAEAICNALTQDSPPGFRPIGPLSWAGESSTGLRAARGGPAEGRLAAERPAVFVIPGILGSHLKSGTKRIWLSWRVVGGLSRIAYPDAADPVTPDGPIGPSYDDLIEFLSTTHDVVPFPFDWRRPIEEEARRLAVEMDAAMSARAVTGQPVRLIAHSMGGLVARTVQLERPDVWNRWIARPGSRLVMLGTPNAGSWAPMQVLSGDDTFGNALAALGEPFEEQAARQVMADMPGFIQLQAALLEGDLGQESTWRRLADEDLAIVRKRSWWHSWWYSDEDLRLAFGWGVPGQQVLAQAVALRKRLDEQREGALPRFRDQLALVVGRSEFTPDGYDVDPQEGLAYLDAENGGDGRVTLASALLPGVRTWSVECPHGDLADAEGAFDAYLELLTRGDTVLIPGLDSSGGRSRDAGGVATPAQPVHVRSRPSRERGSASLPPQGMDSVFDVGDAADASRRGAPAGAPRRLNVTVTNGDLKFISLPLMVGHYVSKALTGTEAVVDRFIGGSMGHSMSVGLYPDLPASHQVFENTRRVPDNPWAMPRPRAVLVVGLGEENKLRGSDLTHSVRQAVLAWAQRVMEGSDGGRATFDLATTLIGSGGIGHTAGTSAQAVARGVREANEQLAQLADQRWPQVGHLHLIELYLDRATEAWRSLQVLAAASPAHFAVGPTVLEGVGSLRRPLDNSYRGTGYDFISAITVKPEKGPATAILYTLDTKRARSEVRAQTTQVRLVRNLVADAARARNSGAAIGGTLFQLLVPIEMEPFLSGSAEILLELDDGTAAIPWELLDAPHDGHTEPWAIRSRLLRKLRTVEYRANVTDSRVEDDVLIIGEPQCDLRKYPPLPGAREEAEAVHAVMSGALGIGADRVRMLLGASAREVIEALLDRSRPYRVVHVAGHGDPTVERPDLPPLTNGVVLSDDTYIGSAEVESMRVVPELVFLNCCHLAADRDKLLEGLDPAAFAASVAKQLIRIGVRCVVAAGWAVDDDAAKTFATVFYRSLLNGQRFMDAVTDARIGARRHSGNTWAAYQCYGDPNWTWRRHAADDRQPGPPLRDEFAAVASADALKLALDTLVVGSRFQGAAPEVQREKIRHLEARFEATWGHVGSVAEAFGHAHSEAKDPERAIRWYERALAANDGGVSARAGEQLANHRARRAWSAVEKARKAARAPDADRSKLDEALSRGRDEIASAIALLGHLVALSPTIERESMIGSAEKRLVMIERTAGRPVEELGALNRMKEHYGAAEKLALATDAPNLFYPAMNRMAAELMINAADKAWPGFDPDGVARVRRSLERTIRDEPDFWSCVAPSELRMYEALAARDLAGQVQSIIAEYKDLHDRVRAAWMWSSVRDQAEFVLSSFTGDEAQKEAARLLKEFLAGCAKE